LVVAASPLSRHIEALQEMENYGAGAVVLHSLFEEPLVSDPRNVDNYLEHVALAKRRLKIPVIASLNAVSTQGWASLATSIEMAGASALELNIYQMTISVTASSSQIEAHYLEAARAVTSAIKIPVAVKMHPYFTNVAFMARELEEAGVKGLVLFNRFYQPDLDLKTMGPGHSLRLSTAAESRLSRRWISLLYRPIQADLIASTGIRSGDDVLKMILSGAAATQICSVILQRGIPCLGVLEDELRQAMRKCRITSLKGVRGELAHRCTEVASSIEREEYQMALQGYSQFDAPSWHDEIHG
jgi:dihydroorotate dehydrogenase (fumarate)